MKLLIKHVFSCPTVKPRPRTVNHLRIRFDVALVSNIKGVTPVGTSIFRSLFIHSVSDAEPANISQLEPGF